jgi:hypothetical protein
MSEKIVLLPAEISLLRLYSKGLIRLLNASQTTFNFTILQIYLSNSDKPLPPSTTASIINILRFHNVLTVFQGRQREFTVDKNKLKELIQVLVS